MGFKSPLIERNKRRFKYNFYIECNQAQGSTDGKRSLAPIGYSQHHNRKNENACLVRVYERNFLWSAFILSGITLWHHRPIGSFVYFLSVSATMIVFSFFQITLLQNRASNEQEGHTLVINHSSPCTPKIPLVFVACFNKNKIGKR